MKSLLFCFLIGCASAPYSIEVPQQLPSTTHHINHKQLIIKQPKHFITEDQRDNEWVRLDIMSIKMHEEIGDVNWLFMTKISDEYRDLIDNIIEKIKLSKTTEEFEYYRHLFFDCVNLLERYSEIYVQENHMLNEIKTNYDKGSKNEF